MAVHRRNTPLVNKKQFVKAFVWSVTLFGCETCTRPLWVVQGSRLLICGQLALS